MQKSSTLNGKVVWLTGASSGIGEELCYQLAEIGASLIISARSVDKLELVSQKLRDLGSECVVLPLDLERHGNIPAIANKAWSAFGHIDILINNAGLAIRDYALNTNFSIDQKLMNINYLGPVLLTKSILPNMLDLGSGHIVVVSSLSGKYGVPQTSSYAATKHALHGFFETLRSETYHRGIQITMIVPGIIKTSITKHALTGSGAAFNKVEKSFETAYPVDKAAMKIIRAIEKGKEEVFVGGAERITLWLNRISPYALRRFIRNHPMKKMRKFKKLLSFKSRK